MLHGFTISSQQRSAKRNCSRASQKHLHLIQKPLSRYRGHQQQQVSVTLTQLNSIRPFPQVYDYDWAFRDDFMGEASVQLSRLELDKTHDLLIRLTDHGGGKADYFGQVGLSLRLEPRPLQDRSASIVSGLSSVASAAATATTSSGPEMRRMRSGAQSWSAIVNVVLIEGKELLAMDFEGTSDPYCKFR